MVQEMSSPRFSWTALGSYSRPDMFSAKFSQVRLQDGQYWCLVVSCGPRPPTDDEVRPYLRTFFGDDSPQEEAVDSPVLRQFVAPIRNN